MHATLRYLLSIIGGALLVVLLYLGSEAWKQRREHERLLAMPPADRAALFDRQRSDFDRLCVQADDFESWCEKEAEFLLGFPECDDACRRAAARYAPGASR